MNTDSRPEKLKKSRSKMSSLLKKVNEGRGSLVEAKTLSAAPLSGLHHTSNGETRTPDDKILYQQQQKLHALQHQLQHQEDLLQQWQQMRGGAIYQDEHAPEEVTGEDVSLSVYLKDTSVLVSLAEKGQALVHTITQEEHELKLSGRKRKPYTRK